MHVDIMMYDGVDELDALGPYEVFSNALEAGADIGVALVGIEDTRRVRASHGVELGPVTTFEPDPDGWLLVPGGRWTTPSRSSAPASGRA